MHVKLELERGCFFQRIMMHAFLEIYEIIKSGYLCYDPS